MIRPMSLWPRSGRAQLLKRLRAALPRGALLHAAEDIKPYECDGLTMYRQLPLAVALPEDEAQARAVLRACHELRVPVVARGAGTGLSGGALPIASGVLLSLSKFNRILHFDPLARIARVQPGVRNLAISEAAAPHRLFYAPDPSSQIACSIGGNVAENSGGVHCLKYGLTLHNVLRVRALTIEGGVMELGSEAPDAPGCDLLALITGSEGMLAVITEVTVRLLPSPAAAQVIMAAFADVGRAGQAVADIIAAGLITAGLEMMDETSIEAVEPSAQGGDPLDAQALLLCEADGAAEDVAEQIAQMSAILKDGGATTLRVSSSEAERLRLWAGRKAAFPAVGRLAPDYYCVDGTISRKRRRNTGCAAPTCFTPATAICIPSFSTTPTGRSRRKRRNNSAPRSWSCRWRWAAPSPASTAWAWRSSTRCACNSAATNLKSCTRSRRRSMNTACSIPARRCRRCTAAPSTAACTCTAARCRSPICRVFRRWSKNYRARHDGNRALGGAGEGGGGGAAGAAHPRRRQQGFLRQRRRRRPPGHARLPRRGGV